MFINQLSSKGGSHLTFRAVNWWNESPNSHDSLAGLFLSTQPLVSMEPEPSLRESSAAGRIRGISASHSSGRGGKSITSAQQGCRRKATAINDQLHFLPSRVAKLHSEEDKERADGICSLCSQSSDTLASSQSLCTPLPSASTQSLCPVQSSSSKLCSLASSLCLSKVLQHFWITIMLTSTSPCSDSSFTHIRPRHNPHISNDSLLPAKPMPQRQIWP